MSERIQKFLSGLGYGSRREVEDWIVEGRLVVNGEAATVGQKIGETDAVKLDGKRLSLKAGNEPMRVLLYKKRTGEMVTRDDPEGRRTVFRKLPELETGRWIAVGRLDVNTSGLLLMTNHGELARRLTHPSFEQRREYAVRALGEVSEDAFANLRKGVMLEDGEASFESIRFGDNEVEDDEGEGEGGGTSRANKWFIVTISEGRNREVRRLFESQGLTVNRLIRTAYGPIKLGGGIKSGSFREATAEELRRLIEAVNLDEKELLPERVRESHRTKSDYSLNKPQKEGEAAPAVPVKRGDSKTAVRAAARVKRDARRENDGARWVKATKDERKLVERAERRGGSENEESTYVVQKARAAADSPWGKTRIAAVESLEKVTERSDAAPTQHKAKGFGARSERSYSERGDRAPDAPTRSYKRDASDGESRAAGPYGARKSAPYAPREGAATRDKPSFSERKPYGDKPAYGAAPRKPYGDRSARDEAPRSTRSDADRPRFARADKPSVSKPYPRKDGSIGERTTFKPRGEMGAERKPYGDRARSSEGAGFKPRFSTASGDGTRPAYKPRAPAGAERPRFGGGERKTYGAKPATRPANATQRFVVKDGAATRPGKPQMGLKKKKDETDD